MVKEAIAPQNPQVNLLFVFIVFDRNVHSN
jgi:hypothetical protein